MSPAIVLTVIIGYFAVLLLISYLTSRNATSLTFFTANRQSPWYLVAFGMVGATLSGVTFISVPGEVGNSGFSYFQVVLGYIPGYIVIALVLLPLYYKLNLVSIYGYLEQRFGYWAYKTGAFFFLISRVIGAAFRMFLVAGVLQIALFDSFGVPFWVTVMVAILLIWFYTYQGGIKTVVWTDSLQTFFMLAAVGVSIYLIAADLNIGLEGIATTIETSGNAQIFFWDWQSENNFFKQFFSGAFIAIVMTGLDQDMMQKNLTCRNLKDAQKNMFVFLVVLVFVNFLFLSLGALLFEYAAAENIPLPQQTDDLFPTMAIEHFHILAGIVFLLGITAAAYSSADSALTALTTSFCVDFLEKSNGKEQEEKGKNIPKGLRTRVHLMFSVIIFLVILIFDAINNESVIIAVFKAAGYTYGPILGLFAYGLFTHWEVHDRYVPHIALLSPVICYIININSAQWLWGYQFGFEILILNGLLTFLGLVILRRS